MELVGQMVEQGLQGISCRQWITGITPSSPSGKTWGSTLPGWDLSSSALAFQAAGTSPVVAPSARATVRPAMRPLNMADEASAISAASPAANTGSPAVSAWAVNSAMGSRPTATSSVSQAKVFSVPASGPEALVDLGDGHRLDALAAVGRQHGVRGVDGHAQALELVGVDLVAAAGGERLGQAHHGDAGLDGVVAGDQPDVAAADDEQAARGAHQVAVDQGLEGAGAVDADQVVAGKDQRFFAGAGGVEHHLGHDQLVCAVAQHADLAVGIDIEHRAVGPDGHVRVGGHRLGQLAADAHAAGAGLRVLDRAEELVGLQHQLAAGLVLVVDEQGGDAQAPELDGGRKPGRPGADDQHVGVDLGDAGGTPGPGPRLAAPAARRRR